MKTRSGAGADEADVSAERLRGLQSTGTSRGTLGIQEHVGRGKRKADCSDSSDGCRKKAATSTSTTPRTPKPRPPWDNLSANKELGKDLLSASPSASDKRSVSLQNPLLMRAKDGILPASNKMVPPPQCDEFGRPREQYMDVMVAMGRAVDQGSKHWAVIASCLGEGVGKELNERPLLLAALGGVFLCIPPEDYQMTAEERVDVLVYKDGVVVKKALSPPFASGKFAYEVGSEPGSRKKKKGAKEAKKIVRFKTDVVAQGLDEQGQWQNRLSIEHKGKIQHVDDRWECLSGACRIMIKGLQTGSLEPRHYAHLWTGGNLEYQILDVFGAVDVRNGIITKPAYLKFLGQFWKMREYMGDNFPIDSLHQWVAMVDVLAPGSKAKEWEKQQTDKDPFTRSRLQWYLQHQQEQLLSEYNLVFPNDTYIVGICYYEPKPMESLISSSIRFEAAVWLTHSILRIILGDHVLDWNSRDLQKVMDERLRKILEKAEGKISRNLNEKINVFNVQSMGTKNSPQSAQQIGGDWEVHENDKEWLIRIRWKQWEVAGSTVRLKKTGLQTFLHIQEGPLLEEVSRIVIIQFPQPITSAKVTKNNTARTQDLTIVCSKATCDSKDIEL